MGRTILSVLRPLKIETSRVPQTYGNLTLLEGEGCSGCPVTNRMALSFRSDGPYHPLRIAPTENRDLPRASDIRKPHPSRGGRMQRMPCHEPDGALFPI